MLPASKPRTACLNVNEVKTLVWLEFGGKVLARHWEWMKVSLLFFLEYFLYQMGTLHVGSLVVLLLFCFSFCGKT